MFTGENRMSVWSLPRVTFRDLSSIQETRPVALLTTDEVWAVLGTQLTLPVMIQAEPARYSHELFDYLADHLPTQVQAIYAVGSGAPVEAGKAIAARNDKPLIVIPTALDSNRPFVPDVLTQVEDEQGTRLMTVEGAPASEVIIDWALIQAAPNEQRGAGIVDVLSVVTGLLDWRYAAQKNKNPVEQRFTPWAASVAAGLASQAIKSAGAIGQGNRDALHTLLDLMMIGVQLCNQLGHMRACEGSEHFLAQALAEQAGMLPHAEMVGPCILIASALHGQDPAPLRDAMTSAGVRLDQLRATDVRMALDNLPNVIGAYAFPHSILNDLDPLSEQVASALEAAGLYLAADTWQLPQEEGAVEGEAVEQLDLSMAEMPAELEAEATPASPEEAIAAIDEAQDAAQAAALAEPALQASDTASQQAVMVDEAQEAAPLAEDTQAAGLIDAASMEEPSEDEITNG
jgi:glycerol dehydrogenase-like iron-containing ADH family enzyme